MSRMIELSRRAGVEALKPSERIKNEVEVIMGVKAGNEKKGGLEGDRGGWSVRKGLQAEARGMKSS